MKINKKCCYTCKYYKADYQITEDYSLLIKNETNKTCEKELELSKIDRSSFYCSNYKLKAELLEYLKKNNNQELINELLIEEDKNKILNDQGFKDWFYNSKNSNSSESSSNLNNSSNLTNQNSLSKNKLNEETILKRRKIITIVISIIIILALIIFFIYLALKPISPYMDIYNYLLANSNSNDSLYTYNIENKEIEADIDTFMGVFSEDDEIYDFEFISEVNSKTNNTLTLTSKIYFNYDSFQLSKSINQEINYLDNQLIINYDKSNFINPIEDSELILSYNSSPNLNEEEIEEMIAFSSNSLILILNSVDTLFKSVNASYSLI